MTPAVRCAAAAAVIFSAAPPADAQTFDGAPIACGTLTAFKTCTASFDGWTLTIAYSLAPGKPSLAIYRMCAVIERHINCAGGEWRSGQLAGPLGARTIALKDGLPFPE
jgi:hypothetical protein